MATEVKIKLAGMADRCVNNSPWRDRALDTWILFWNNLWYLKKIMHIDSNVYSFRTKKTYQEGCFHSCPSDLYYDGFQQTGGYDASFAQQQMWPLEDSPPLNLRMPESKITNNCLTNTCISNSHKMHKMEMTEVG